MAFPFDDVASPEDFELRLFDRLALLERHGDGHLIDARSRISEAAFRMIWARFAGAVLRQIANPLSAAASASSRSARVAAETRAPARSHRPD